MAEDIRYNGTGLIVAKDYGELSEIAAEMVIGRVKAKPDLNLLVPTGKTPLGLYKILSEENDGLFSKATFFNFDEYAKRKDGPLIDSADPVSFRRAMKESFFGKVNVKSHFFPSENNFVRNGLYDQLIYSFGGIDLCIDAMGEDGHTFGFNFPGTLSDSRTRVVRIPQRVREINRVKSGYETPLYALTTGIETGLNSEEIIVLVSGYDKADILKRTLADNHIFIDPDA